MIANRVGVLVGYVFSADVVPYYNGSKLVLIHLFGFLITLC